jgi:uncharacterized protein (TIGR02145 family)
LLAIVLKKNCFLKLEHGNPDGMKQIIWITGIALMLLSCEKNHPPVISSFDCSPNSRNAGSTYSLTVIATDQDGDSLRYQWTADGGDFTEGATGFQTQWKSPESSVDKKYNLKVEVSDGVNAVEKSIEMVITKSLFGTISGDVCYSGCTIPISGVTLSVAGKTSATGPDGKFNLVDVPAGIYSLTSSKTDYDSVSKEISVNIGATTTVNVAMTSLRYTSIVHGTVKDQNDMGISGAGVVILNPDNSESELRTITGASGFYYLPKVPQGERTIVVAKTGDPRYRYDLFQSKLSIEASDYPYDIEVNKISLVPTVITREVDTISWNHAKGGGKVLSTGESNLVKRGVCWSTGTSPTISDSKTENGTGLGIFFSELTLLSENQVYYYAAYATNSGGQTGYGEILEFRTAERYGKMTDIRDGKQYTTTKIGDQTWMAENLAFLPAVHPSASGSDSEVRYYVFGYDGNSISDAKNSTNFPRYGTLYNWPAAMNGASGSNSIPGAVQGVCPNGWHLPSDAEWTVLTDYLGSTAGRMMKSTTGWNSDGNGDNASGFDAVPGGRCSSSEGFGYLGVHAFFWSSTENESNSAWYRSLSYSSASVTRYPNLRRVGFSVRCLRNY